jgi:predicted nucleic acid-binding protein
LPDRKPFLGARAARSAPGRLTTLTDNCMAFLLIGTAAVIDGVPLVTHNTRHFSRVTGLQLIRY